MRHSAAALIALSALLGSHRHPRPAEVSRRSRMPRPSRRPAPIPRRRSKPATKTENLRAPTISPGRPTRRRPPARTARATRRRIRCPAAAARKSPARTRRRRTRRAGQRRLERGRRASRQPDRAGEILQAQRRHRPPADHGDAGAALSDEQKRTIVDAVRAANPPVQSTTAKPAEELPPASRCRTRRRGQRSGIRQDEICADAGPHPADRAEQPHRDRRDSGISVAYRG